MTGYGRIAILGALLGLAGCSHEGESEPARGAEEVGAQVGAEAGEAGGSEYKVRPPVDEVPLDDVFNGARHYECTNGQRFSVDLPEGEDGGLIVTKAGEEYFLPRVARDRYFGDAGELTVTSPSQTSLALADEQELRSCVRVPMNPG